MLIILLNCSRTEPGLRIDLTIGETYPHQGIQLHFSPQLYRDISFETEAEILSFNVKQDVEWQLLMPSHFIYVNDKEVAKISGKNSELLVSFEDYLLLMCTEAKYVN